MKNTLTVRQLFVLEKALVYFLSNVEDYNDCMREIEEEDYSLITEKEVEEVILILSRLFLIF